MRKLFCLLCLLAALLPGCDRNKEAGPELILGVMPSMDYLPLAVAAREGYFQEQGLRIKLQKFYSAHERDAALQSGAIDGAVIDYTGVALQLEGGHKLKLTSRCDAPFYIVAGKSSGIHTLAEMRGRSVALAANTVIDYCLDRALNSAGLNGEDVRKLEIGKIPLRFEMLSAGKADAAGLPEPFARMASLDGGKVLASNSALGFSITGIAFNENALTLKSGLIAEMYRGYDRGVEYIERHGLDSVREILIKDFAFLPEILQGYSLPSYGKTALPEERDLRQVLDWLEARALLKGNLQPADLVDARFAEPEKAGHP